MFLITQVMKLFTATHNNRHDGCLCQCISFSSPPPVTQHLWALTHPSLKTDILSSPLMAFITPLSWCVFIYHVCYMIITVQVLLCLLLIIISLFLSNDIKYQCYFYNNKILLEYLYWLRQWTVVGSREHVNEVRFHEWEVSWVPECLLASQDRICFMKH
jgi:hypothetical protein